MLSRLPPALSLPPHRRNSTTGRLPRSRRRSRFLRFLQSQRKKELRSRFLQSQHEHELRSDSTLGDCHSLLQQSLDATDVGAQLQHEDEESESGSGSELDSPPRITMLPEPELEEEPDFLSSPCPTSPPHMTMLPEPELEEEPDFHSSPCPTSPPRISMEPDSPTSPSGPPRSVEVDSTGSPKDTPNDEDHYFNYPVDNFDSVVADVCNSTLPGDETDYKVELQRQSVLCAESALKHYNNDEKNKIKYELISAAMYNDMLIREGCFSHVNFTAKSNQPNAKEELFFAELRWDHSTPEPICVICLKGIKKIGGLCDTKYDNLYLEGLPVDKQNCYGCNHQLKHPKNGELYNIGHIAMSRYYHCS